MNFAEVISFSHTAVAAAGIASAAIEIGMGVGKSTMFAFGALISEVISAIIKNIIQQPRPEFAPSSCFRSGHFGMPSSHAQLLCFTLAFIWSCNHPIRNFLLCIWSILIGWSRISSGCHSLEQVLLGATLGLLIGFLFRFIKPSYLLKNKQIPKPFFENGVLFSRSGSSYITLTLLIGLPSAICGTVFSFSPKGTLKILFYNGNLIDCLINYFALFQVMLAITTSTLPAIRSRFPAQKSILFFSLEPMLWWLLAFQLLICLIFNEVGVSLIWNTFLPYALLGIKSIARVNAQFSISLVSVIFALVADLYYLFTQPLLTTIAHISAIALGCIILLIQWYFALKYTLSLKKSAVKK